jgi:hypothetical protein
MAKAASAAAAAISTAPPLTSAFPISFGEGPAPITRKIGGEKSPYTSVMQSMPLPQGDKVASFFIAAGMAPTELPDGEKTKWTADQVRKITNRVSGLARRLKKKDGAYNFAVRSREEGGASGIRVYRIAAETAALAA